MKNKEADTVNQAMKKILKHLGTPESIYCDEGSEFTKNKFLQLLDDDKIKIIYATNHAPFVESFNRTMKSIIYKSWNTMVLQGGLISYKVCFMHIIQLFTVPQK